MTDVDGMFHDVTILSTFRPNQTGRAETLPFGLRYLARISQGDSSASSGTPGFHCLLKTLEVFHDDR